MPMPRLSLTLKPNLDALRRFKPPKPPSLEEMAQRAEAAFIQFNQGPCVDGKAHLFKTQPFPPYAREFCAKCGVDKDDLATHREGLRTYHGMGERLWSGGPLPASAAGAGALVAASARRAGIGVPPTLAIGIVLLAIGASMTWPPLTHSGVGMFIVFAGLALSIVSGMIWATDVGTKSKPALRRYYGFSDAQPKAEARALPQPPARPQAVALPLLGALSLALFVVGLVLVWPPLAESGAGLLSLFAGLALGIVAGIVWAAGGRAKSRHGP